MRTLIALAAIATTAWSSLGQGTVDFRNQSSVLGTANDYWVRDGSTWPWWLSAPLVNSGTSLYVAQLFYGPVGSSPWSFTPVAAAPAAFRSAGTSLPGTWIGGTRTIPAPYGISGITSVDLQVRVWDSSLAADWYAATSPRYMGWWGTSDVFTFDFFVSSPPAVTDDDMINFRGFFIGIPEPSCLALLGLGALGLYIFRQK